MCEDDDGDDDDACVGGEFGGTVYSGEDGDTGRYVDDDSDYVAREDADYDVGDGGNVGDDDDDYGNGNDVGVEGSVVGGGDVDSGDDAANMLLICGCSLSCCSRNAVI